MKLSIIHIHTDTKFLHNSRMFMGAYFTNTSIVISQNKVVPETNQEVLFFSRRKDDFRKIVELCSKADLVVLYDLDPIKIKIVLALPKEVKIAWRFFGHELYKKKPSKFKSELSRKHDVRPFKKRLKQRLKLIYQTILTGKSKTERFNDVIKRINYFLALSQEEYSLIKKYWPEIPYLIKLPHFHFDRRLAEVEFKEKEDKPSIIIGNNRSSYNNHLDLISLIENHDNKLNYNFMLFFNYGPRGKYFNKVLEATSDKKHYTVITDFLNMNDFISIYQKATALVINGYRQMAGANIRTALEHGVKVYLNNKNVHKQFLENQGFKLFSIEDFETDLKNNNLILDKETVIQNIKNFKRFSETYTPEDFQKKLFKQLVS